LASESDNGASIPPALNAIPLSEMEGEDVNETLFFKEMAEMAARYVRSYGWCLELKEGYFGDGIGGIIAIFLFQVTVKGFDGDQWVWVFMGELPSAYLILGGHTSPQAALKKYVSGLEEWADAAERGRPLNDLIPVELSPRTDVISKVRSTITSLREIVLPNIRDD